MQSLLVLYMVNRLLHPGHIDRRHGSLSVPVLAATGGINCCTEPITMRYGLASIAEWTAFCWG
jgi:hypothetical protein